jgi:hypothetical protein
MSDLGILLQPLRPRPSASDGGRRMPWPVRVLPGLAACGLAGLLVAGLLEPRGAEPIAPKAESSWADAGAPIYGLDVAGFIQPPLGVAWTRRDGPGRLDILTYGDGPADGDWLRVTVQQAGSADPAPGSFYLDLTRAAARAGVAVIRASLPDLLATRFGGFEVAEVALTEGAGARACLGFRLLAGAPDLRILGFACGRDRQPDRTALACTLEGLRLRAPGADASIARFFAAAEITRGLDSRPGCETGRTAAKPGRRT